MCGISGVLAFKNSNFQVTAEYLVSMRETLALAKNLNCEFANFYSAMAYPGSQLYQMAIQQKLGLPETWGGFSQHAVDTLPLPTKYLSSGEVLSFRDKAFQVYYTNPKYLDTVQKKFGAETVEHIRYMTSHKLQRKFGLPSAPAVGAGSPQRA